MMLVDSNGGKMTTIQFPDRDEDLVIPAAQVNFDPLTGFFVFTREGQAIAMFNRTAINGWYIGEPAEYEDEEPNPEESEDPNEN